MANGCVILTDIFRVENDMYKLALFSDVCCGCKTVELLGQADVDGLG